MSKLFRRLQGYSVYEASGAFPERLLNLCGYGHVKFWRLEKLDETTYRFRIAVQDRKRLEEYAQRAMCSLEEKGRYGAVPILDRLRHRAGFLAGLALCLLFAGFLSRFIWVIDISGAETVPEPLILAELSRQGVRIGAWGPSIAGREISNRALLRLQDLAWMSVHVDGVRAAVSVLERKDPPVVVDEDAPADVQAAESGVITSILVQSGQPLFQAGQVVAKGETLIAGWMDLEEPQGTPMDLGWHVVRAVGSVRARVNHTLEETVPLTAWEKRYTGEEKKAISLRLFEIHLDFLENSSNVPDMYDRITQTTVLSPRGMNLPACLRVHTLREYTLEEVPIDQAAEEARLQALLQHRLDRLMEERDGTVFSQEFRTRIYGGCLTVTLLADCEEEIGRTVELPGETGRFYGEQGQNEQSAP